MQVYLVMAKIWLTSSMALPKVIPSIPYLIIGISMLGSSSNSHTGSSVYGVGVIIVWKTKWISRMQYFMSDFFWNTLDCFMSVYVGRYTIYSFELQQSCSRPPRKDQSLWSLLCNQIETWAFSIFWVEFYDFHRRSGELSTAQLLANL